MKIEEIVKEKDLTNLSLEELKTYKEEINKTLYASEKIAKVKTFSLISNTIGAVFVILGVYFFYRAYIRFVFSSSLVKPIIYLLIGIALEVGAYLLKRAWQNSKKNNEKIKSRCKSILDNINRDIIKKEMIAVKSQENAEQKVSSEEQKVETEN